MNTSLVVHSPYMYILLEWLTYQHVAVDLACVTIGACLSRDTMQQDSVCGHLPLFLSPLRSFTPVLATSASGHYFINIW